MMRKHQLEIIEGELLALNQSRLDILEWGSGGSTIHFTGFLLKNGIDYNWISIEHNKEWYNSVSDELRDDKNLKVYLLDEVQNSTVSVRNVDMDDYVSFPASLGRRFDFILVDGRKRRRCLLEAAKLLKPHGIVILHDAQRSYYHCGLNHFPDSRFMDMELWRGSHTKLPMLKRNSNKLLYVYYRFIRLLYKNGLLSWEDADRA